MNWNRDGEATEIFVDLHKGFQQNLQLKSLLRWFNATLKEGKKRMANSEHLAILRQGVMVWNQWRKNNPEIIPDLRGVDLRGADLRVAGYIITHLAGCPPMNTPNGMGYAHSKMNNKLYTVCIYSMSWTTKPEQSGKEKINVEYKLCSLGFQGTS